MKSLAQLLAMLGLALALTPFDIQAQLPRAHAESVGMSGTRLARIAAVLRHSVDDHAIAGVVALIARDGRIVELDSAGWRDAASRSPMGRNTIFRIASMTKAITSVAAMMLVEEGRIRLGDSVSKFIPEFAQTRVRVGRDSLVPMERPMRVHDLLTHRSGLVYVFNDTSAVGRGYRKAGVATVLAWRGLAGPERVAPGGAAARVPAG